MHLICFILYFQIQNLTLRLDYVILYLPVLMIYFYRKILVEKTTVFLTFFSIVHKI
jgi:hypothetical protein